MRLLDEYEVDPEESTLSWLAEVRFLASPLGCCSWPETPRSPTATRVRVTCPPSCAPQISWSLRSVDLDLVRGDWIKPGAVVIDAGYNEGNVGDVAFSEPRRWRA